MLLDISRLNETFLHIKANAFGGTFVFFTTAQTNTKKSKRATKPTHQDISKQWTTEQRQKEHQLITAPTKNWRFSASYDSFVVNQTFVLRMNICGKNHQLLVAAKRYVQSQQEILRKKFSKKIRQVS